MKDILGHYFESPVCCIEMSDKNVYNLKVQPIFLKSNEFFVVSNTFGSKRVENKFFTVFKIPAKINVLDSLSHFWGCFTKF